MPPIRIQARFASDAGSAHERSRQACRPAMRRWSHPDGHFARRKIEHTLDCARIPSRAFAFDPGLQPCSMVSESKGRLAGFIWILRSAGMFGLGAMAPYETDRRRIVKGNMPLRLSPVPDRGNGNSGIILIVDLKGGAWRIEQGQSIRRRRSRPWRTCLDGCPDSPAWSAASPVSRAKGVVKLNSDPIVR